MKVQKVVKLIKNKEKEMIPVEILSVTLTALLSVAVMFILAKLIGNRAISQMNLFDYVNSITIGSIAAELATSDVENMLDPLVAMVIYAIAVIVFAQISCKSLGFRRFVEGRTIILMKNGKIYNKNFDKAKIDINEFLMQCRLLGYFNLNDIKTAVQESNGKISILPTTAARPVKTQDLKLTPAEDTLYTNVILDGKVLSGNLQNAGYNEDWLNKELKKQNISHIKDIYLAVCSKNGDFYIYEKQDRKDKKDMFDL